MEKKKKPIAAKESGNRKGGKGDESEDEDGGKGDQENKKNKDNFIAYHIYCLVGVAVPCLFLNSWDVIF